jgi:hypothetical protein
MQMCIEIQSMQLSISVSSNYVMKFKTFLAFLLPLQGLTRAWRVGSFFALCTNSIQSKCWKCSRSVYFNVIFLCCYLVNLISTVLLLSLGLYICWWTISFRGYHPPNSQFLNNTIIIKTKVLLTQA